MAKTLSGRSRDCRSSTSRRTTWSAGGMRGSRFMACSHSRVHLHRWIAGVTRDDPAFDDSIAGVLAIAHFDDLVAERARGAPRCSVEQVPAVVLDVERALVVA